MLGILRRRRELEDNRHSELLDKFLEVEEDISALANNHKKLFDLIKEMNMLLRTALNMNNDTAPQAYTRGQYDRLMQLQQQLNAQVGNLVVEPVEIPEEFRENRRKK